jgi:(p)ppGpp synthase/HD superfamily hydrolase
MALIDPKLKETEPRLPVNQNTLGVMKMNDIVDRAELFARAAHGAIGQIRKYTGEAYVTHPIRVMGLVKTVLKDPDALAAALLHDVIEDTELTKEDILTEFGPRVAEMVVALSDPPKVEGGPNRKARKALDRDRLSKASASVQTIKVADMIDNTESIVAHDPKFAKIYLEEKRLLLDVLTKADAGLVHVARNQITIRR